MAPKQPHPGVYITESVKSIYALPLSSPNIDTKALEEYVITEMQKICNSFIGLPNKPETKELLQYTLQQATDVLVNAGYIHPATKVELSIDPHDPSKVNIVLTVNESAKSWEVAKPKSTAAVRGLTTDFMAIDDSWESGEELPAKMDSLTRRLCRIMDESDR